MRGAQVTKWMSMVGCLGLLGTGCSGNSIDGTLADHEFGRIKTAFVSFEDDGEGGKIPLMLMVDTEWTCEQAQLLLSTLDDETPAELYTDDVIGGILFELARVGENGEDIVGSTATGPYEFFDASGDNVPDAGTQIALGYALIGKVDASQDDEVLFVTMSGTLNVDALDTGTGMAGDFEVTVESEDGAAGALTGSFDLALCDLLLEVPSPLMGLIIPHPAARPERHRPEPGTSPAATSAAAHRSHTGS